MTKKHKGKHSWKYTRSIIDEENEEEEEEEKKSNKIMNI